MKNLQDTVAFIDLNYHQELVDLNDFDFALRTNVLIKQPKFLFRGERTIKWNQTKSTVSRKNLSADPNFDEINYWVSGLHQVSGQTLNRYSLYFFLREALWTISCVVDDHDDKVVQSIAGLLQHYEFDTSFIDLTSEIKVAAFFACHHGKIGDVGQILVIPTKSIENRFFDLTRELGERPRRQQAYVILAPQTLDLKSQNFMNDFQSVWIKFRMTKEDKEVFNNPSLLTTINDKTATSIYEWFESHIQNSASISGAVRLYFNSKIENLHKYDS